jgi:alkanesulfonate monooxygenase SsuD/methylene tetrahydromethanopterin reductase-like flavin-dependent oxidoreductase (luciferase family)
VRIPLLPPEDCLNLKQTLSINDQAYYDETLNSMIVGTAEECHARMDSLADEYGADEIIVVNVCYDFEDRKRSYELLAEEFKLKKHSPNRDKTDINS